MSIICWGKNYELNIPIIDSQHKKLVELINRLYEALMDMRSKEILEELISELIHYTEYHFKSEEELFEKYNYPLSTKHKQEHSKFVEKVKNFKEDFESGNDFLDMDIIVFLNEWLIKHILGSDKRFSIYIKEKMDSENP